MTVCGERTVSVVREPRYRAPSTTGETPVSDGRLDEVKSSPRSITVLVAAMALLATGACASDPGLRIDGAGTGEARFSTSSPRDTASPQPVTAPSHAPAREAQTPDRTDRTATPAAETSTARVPDATLEQGDEGSAVRSVQRRLMELGYWLDEPDGRFGTLTRQAVLAFQGWEQLRRDGVVGPSTRQRLAQATPPSPVGSGDLIEIHRGRGVLLIVRDGSTRWALHTSTGTGERYRQPDGDVAVADTPAGSWEITWQVDGWRESDLGRLWRPKYFHRDGIAIHGYPEVPAYPASHGCARVSIEAMDMIWRQGLAPEGSTVVVH